jgi:centromeric protein E
MILDMSDMSLCSQIIDEKSLIKKYQTEIRRLNEELEQLKMGIITGTPSKDTGEDNMILWKQEVLCCFVQLQLCSFLLFD